MQVKVFQLEKKNLGNRKLYLHVHRELPPSVISPAVFVAVAVRVHDAGLAEVWSWSERGEVFAPGEGATGELRQVCRVGGIWLWSQQEGWRHLSTTVLALELRTISGHVEQRVLEGERVAERGGLLLLLLGQ